MNSRYQTDDDLQDLHDSREQDREISLGTTTILGIFFVLGLLCAVFFGFGYSLGRRSAPPVATTAENTSSNPESTASKPSPGSLAAHAASPLPVIVAEDASQRSSLPDASATQPTEATQPAPTPARAKAVAADFRPEPAIKPTGRPAAVAPIPSAAQGGAIVQVAAVSHQEDADVLVNALKQRGYSVTIHKEPQDKLLHVQIGPFFVKKDADAMRQRLQTDGYNAIVK
ncbi:SPOR domain-containing protein [Tunturibacter empetritectus]|uniref:Cell division septation protein DedD n=1 Tax=Tunturiibacter empetritectus TaxID=3069691 RepID=A0A7W8MSI9_9BACT|nr:SPOR domain-containing protein [Edaphobacter lichenicola]MBB5319031.1 cell division septation protein DedD [Edaphobacter lichenicola]